MPLSKIKRVLVFPGVPWVRVMCSVVPHVSKMYSDAGEIISASISAVSPPKLISKALSFDSNSNTLSVADHKFQVNNNVKVVGSGKAVLGMASAVECILGQHITDGVVSVPIGAVDVARKYYPHHLLRPDTKIKVYEGAADNLPDSASETAAREALCMARRCGQDNILIALVSGGGSALLPYPVDGVTVQEKRKVVESLARRGADIREMNTLRKAISQTKGGRLAEAAFPAKVLGLILSDVIGDPLDIIASGPTVPQGIDNTAALRILDKYGLQDVHSSVSMYLRTQPPQQQVSKTIREDCLLNLVIGNNKMATMAAKATAISHGYTCYVWSQGLQGEASFLGKLYALLTHYLTLKHSGDTEEQGVVRDMLHTHLETLSQERPELKTDILNLIRSVEMVVPGGGGFCLIGAGEPTVTLRGEGRGGRNQELALAYIIKLHELRDLHSGSRPNTGGDCVFVSVGTDGQDGPCDAAGAMVDPSVFTSALEQGLDPLQSILDNDSYTFFSTVNSGRNLLKTGLTGTNVMDIHILLMK